MNLVQLEFRACFSIALRQTNRFEMVRQALDEFLLELATSGEGCPIQIAASALVRFCKMPSNEPGSGCFYGVLYFLDRKCRLKTDHVGAATRIAAAASSGDRDACVSALGECFELRPS